jgi:GH24 family phage-related lysozyme (muramidase)
MKPSDKLTDFLKKQEGLLLTVCRDTIATGSPPHVGYGHKDASLRVGDSITEGRAEALLQSDIREAAGHVVGALRGAATTQSQFDAMVSLAFNVGGSRFARSTLVARHKAGDYERAAAEFLRWKYSGGKIRDGLLKRRRAEKRMYEGK